MARKTPRKRRPTTRAGRRQASLAAALAGRKRRVVQATTAETQDALANINFGHLVARNLLDAEQQEYFRNRTCGCLFLLEKIHGQFQRCVHGGKGSDKRVAGKVNLQGQNQICARLFDVNGNPLYDRGCILTLFKISNSRYSTIHRNAQVDHRVRIVLKKDVRKDEVHRIVYPPEAMDADGPVAWWERMDEDDPVELHVAVGHGLRFSAGNRRKTALTVQQFIEFVKANSYPNGRRAASGHAEAYLSAQFTSIGESCAKDPAPGSCSLVDEFNTAQAAINGSFISSTTTIKWMRELCSNVKIRPHATDYCDRCAELALQVNGATMRRQRFLSAGSSSAADIDQAKADLQACKDERAKHLQQSRVERDAYKAAADEACRKWAIVDQVGSPELVAVIAIDFMQEILLPFFGFSPQPGRTYYLMKLNVHIWGGVFLHRIPAFGNKDKEDASLICHGRARGWI